MLWSSTQGFCQAVKGWTLQTNAAFGKGAECPLACLAKIITLFVSQLQSSIKHHTFTVSKIAIDIRYTWTGLALSLGIAWNKTIQGRLNDATANWKHKVRSSTVFLRNSPSATMMNIVSPLSDHRFISHGDLPVLTKRTFWVCCINHPVSPARRNESES